MMVEFNGPLKFNMSIFSQNQSAVTCPNSLVIVRLHFPDGFLTRKLNNVNRLVMVDAMETSTTFCLNMTVGKDVEVNDMPGW